ncbi:uncharacterized protein LOC143282500 [Babylonia areolata]|uniref:uncharacterized protein LOC143282500 n=1 Tax=Babylonia areolata TaxID=304850 RepID=UPI003FD33BC7
MTSSPLMTAACLLTLTLTLTLTLSPGVCASLGSRADGAIPAGRRATQPAEHRWNVGDGKNRWDTASLRAILLILREKCQQWRDLGVQPLPSYCYVLRSGAVGGSSLPRASVVNQFYSQYKKEVSPTERLLALQRARADIGQSESVQA